MYFLLRYLNDILYKSKRYPKIPFGSKEKQLAITSCVNNHMKQLISLLVSYLERSPIIFHITGCSRDLDPAN